MFRSVDPTALEKSDIYTLLTHTVVPRPIAFVTTLSAQNVLNAAPFSYFTVHGTKPAVLSISIGKREGVDKDTAKNIKHTKSFVVHITTEAFIQTINNTSKFHAPNESEVAIYNLTPIKSDTIKVDGVGELPVRFECELYDIIPLKHEGVITSEIFLGKINRIHLLKSLGESLEINPNVLNPVARLGGKTYAPLGKPFELKRPK